MDLTELVKSVTAASGFTHAAAVQVLLVEAGHVVMLMPRKPELLQFNGFFHGGAISGLADHAAGAAATTALPPGRIAVTADLHVNFLKPANGDSMTATAKVISVGSTLCVATVEVTTPGRNGVSLCAFATVMLRSVEAP